MEKLLEDIYHENEIVSKEKGRHWSHRAIDPRQRWEERSLQDELWKAISGNQLCSRSREQPSRLEQANYTNRNKSEIINFKVHKKLYKKRRYHFSKEHSSDML